ncbi:MAG: hypothetical protein C0598_07260 [Marinilabiliales bacterium]|nr:MAG: hypothetical protein C0598_07260 [Marinilabiliales bacterium]
MSLVILGLISCQKGENKDYKAGDSELIEAIINAADKQVVEFNSLPEDAQSTLNSKYFDSDVDIALIAPKLGYEVELFTISGSKAGEQKQVYFALDGRMLMSYYNKGDGDKGDGSDKQRCFEFIYPVTYVLPDGTEVTIDSKDDEEGWNEIKNWYINHPDVAQKPQLQFPVDIKFKDGTIKTISSNKQLRRVFRMCNNDKSRCFHFIYPVTYILPDGTEVIIDSKDDVEGWTEIKDWYINHPDVAQKPAIKFPVDIKFKGEIKTLENEMQLRRVRKACKGVDRCFRLVYPVTFMMLDGTLIEVISNDDEGWAPVKAWYDAHPDVAAKPELQFPVDIKWKDGTIQTINSQEEMILAKEDCNPDHD